MKLSRFLNRIKFQLPSLTGVDDNTLTDLLNDGCDETNQRIKAYKGYTDFDVIAEQQTYAISEIAPNALSIEKKPIYLKDSNGDWQKVYPKTKDWLTRVYPNWLNQESSFPQWYWVEGDELGFHPKPDTSYSTGGRMYHLKKAVDMASPDSYPFSGTTVEIRAFRPMDDAILSYARWKLSPAVGAVTDADLREREYLTECRKAATQIRRRPDIANDDALQIQI